MKERFHLHSIGPERSYVTLSSGTDRVADVQDFLDLIAWGGEHGTNLVLLREEELPGAFFDLSTRIAGDILQKVSNYRIQLAVVGSFQGVSERSREMMRESNKGSQVFYARTTEEAETWLPR